jgi:hypothetical protein
MRHLEDTKNFWMPSKSCIFFTFNILHFSQRKGRLLLIFYFLCEIVFFTANTFYLMLDVMHKMLDKDYMSPANLSAGKYYMCG